MTDQIEESYAHRIRSLRINLKALEIGFEEWRTKMVNEREERRRYGA